MIVFADFTNKQFNDHNLILIIAEKTLKTILHYPLSNTLMTANQNLLQLTQK